MQNSKENKKISVGPCVQKSRYSMLLAITATVVCMLFTGCGPSDDKIYEAQTKYRQLTDTYNQVVSAHDTIEDNSLDEELKAVYSSMEKLKDYNLAEMTEEEIDILIKTMDQLNDSYSGYLKAIGEIKKNEDASVLTSVTVSLANETDITFGELSLMEKGEKDLVTNVLDTFDGFKPNQVITGLTFHKDVDDTPWVLVIKDLEENEYSFDIEVKDLPTDTQKTLTLVLDEETGEVLLQ